MKRNSVLIVGLHIVLSCAASAQTNWSIGPYAYDGAGNVRSIGAANGTTDTFTYDEFGRIRTASVAGHNQQFTYDRFGNLRNVQTGTTTIRLGVDAAANRLSSSTDTLTGQPANAWGTYDPAGQLTQWNSTSGKFEYDGVGMLTSSSDVAGEPHRIYIYTPNDERIATVTLANGAETWSEWTLRDSSGKVLRRIDRYRNASNEWEWRWRQDYIYLNGLLLAAEVDTSEKVRHFFLDHLGSPRLVTGNGGVRIATHTYLPFGAEVTASNPDPERMKFTGHERDTTGLDYVHARYYSSGTGRFLSVDPVLDTREALHEPQLWNRYAYVTNNPLKYTDPDGRYRDGYYEKPLTPENVGDWSTVPEVSWAFRAQGALLSIVASELAGARVYGAVRSLIRLARGDPEAVQQSGERFFKKAPRGSEN
ncbi:MAG: RHS repeat-associated core domain-containing protein, partial [Thermoanaerobaculia bacterium]